MSGSHFGGSTLIWEQLFSTRSYKTKDLRGISLDSKDLTAWDLSEQDLSNADLSYARMPDADLSRAILSGANLYGTDLAGADLTDAIVTNANLRAVNLTDTNLHGASLNGTDLRSSTGLILDTSTVTCNTIMPDGEIGGLTLDAGESVIITSYGSWGTAGPVPPVRVSQEFKMSTDSLLELELGAFRRVYSIPLEFEPAVPIELGGTLRVVSPGSFYVPRANLALFSWREPLESGNVFSTVELPAGNWDLFDLYVTGSISLIALGELGDFDANGVLNVIDIDRLSHVIRVGRDRSFDINFDGAIDRDDHDTWIKDLKETWYGDADLNGEFNSDDLVQVFQVGEYETQQYVGWAEGVWNGDGVFFRYGGLRESVGGWWLREGAARANGCARA